MKVPVKNYVILIIISFVTVLLSLYINAWVKAIREDKISVSPLSGVLEEVAPNEVLQAVSESGEVLVYIGYSNSQKLYDSEKNILNYVKKHGIADKVIYVNVNDFLDDDEYIKILKDTFSEVSEDINKAPLLIYVKNGRAILVKKSKGGVITDKDFSSLIKEYDLE